MRIVIVVLAMFAGYAGMVSADEAAIPAEQAVIQFNTLIGNVTFRHQNHADLSFSECKTCHHTFKAEEGPVKACHSCHEKKAADQEVPLAKVAFHARCTGCHEYTAAKGEPAGPLQKKCKLCHAK